MKEGHFDYTRFHGFNGLDTPPSKESCLEIAEMCFAFYLEELMWKWLLSWVAYETYVEEYWP